MKRAIKLVLVVGVLVAASAAAYGYLRREQPERVTAIKPSRLTIEESVTSTGSVEASRTMLVTLEPGARVAATYFTEQQVVRRGQLLARLDDSDLVSQLAQHRANLALAESNLESAQVNLQRTQRLYDKGFAARQEVEGAARQIDLYRTQVEDRRSAIALIEAKKTRTSISSPISGIVIRKFLEPGGTLTTGDGRPAGQSAGGSVLAEIAELAATEFRADVDQADVAKIRLGQRATVQFDAFPNRLFAATTRGIGTASIPDPTGRVRYEVKLAVEPAGSTLKVGMSGNAKFVVARKEGVLALPISIILQQGADEVVYVMSEGRALLKRVKTGLQGDDMVEVVSGLNPDDLVIDQGRAKLKDGRSVELVDAKR